MKHEKSYIKGVIDTLSHLNTKLPKKQAKLLPGYGCDLVSPIGRIIVKNKKGNFKSIKLIYI